MAHVQEEDASTSPRPSSSYEAQNHDRLRCSDELQSELSWDDDDEHDDEVPEMERHQRNPPEIIRRSTIESYNEDENDDHDETRRSSITLFFHGYREGEPYWERQLQSMLPAPARLPSTRYQAPSRQATQTKADPATELFKDVNLVTWDDDDPLNPHNWPAHRRWTSTILIALFAFIAPMASTMVAPALDDISDEYDIESDIQQFLVMSIFLLAFAIGPFLWGRSINQRLVAHADYWQAPCLKSSVECGSCKAPT